MRELKLCSISDGYIDFLQKDFPNVYSNKETRRTHTRKYIGVVMQISEYLYYIPMSSPKDTDYQVAGDKRVIKKSIVPIMRMVIKNSKGEKELKGTLRFSHMIPVPESEVEWYDVEKEEDEKYKDLVQNEIIFIRKNQEKIRKSAELIYKQKEEHIENVTYLNSVLDYKGLEKRCESFMANDNKKIQREIQHTNATELIEAKEYYEKDGVVDVCKALTELIADGREEGIELTKKVYKLQKLGKSNAEIAKECNIAISQVEAILE